VQPLKQERELLPGAPPISEADARRKLRKAVETAWIINQDPLANGSVWSPFREQIKQLGIVGHMLLTAVRPVAAPNHSFRYGFRECLSLGPLWAHCKVAISEPLRVCLDRGSPRNSGRGNLPRVAQAWLANEASLRAGHELA
jgi:hypothetical protein